jgi:hypothetical protein
MTGCEMKNWKTWAKNAVAELDARDDGGPSYIPILPRHGVYLFCVAGDGRRFARLFGQTWRKLPLWARRRLLKHWRAARRERYGDAPLVAPWPLVELVEFKSDFFRGNSEAACAQYNHRMCSFAFLAETMDRFPDDAVECVIAHELAHAVHCIEDADYHLDPANTEYDAWGYSQSEYFADETAEDWGFDIEARDRAVEEFYGAERPQEVARGL